MTSTIKYYDLVLLAIVVSMMTGVVLGLLTPIAMGVTVGILGLLAIVVIGHALFVNGPVDSVGDLSDEVEMDHLPTVKRGPQLLNR